MDDVFTLKKPREELTFSDLRHHFGTGRSYIKSGSGRDRVYGYRRGVMTDIGDIEESEWKSLMLDLIQRSNEMGIYEALKRWSKECCAWLHSKAEVEEYALELHSARIFENPSWAGYEQFWRDYAPCLAKEGEHRYETGRIDL